MSLPRPDSASQPSGDARARFASANAAAGCQPAAVPAVPPVLSDAERASRSVLPSLVAPGQELLLGSPVKPVPANWSGKESAAAAAGAAHLQFTAWKLAVGGKLNNE